MQHYSTFIFDSYDFNPTKGEVVLRYSLDDEIQFEEKIILPNYELRITNYELRITNYEFVEPTLFALHLIAGISYYKTYCPKKIEVRSGSLTKEQAEFWNTVYTKGLAEFFYCNDINATNLITFPSKNNSVPLQPCDPATSFSCDPATQGKYLVPIGGGKDSMVTAELLKDAAIDFDFFRLGEHPIIQKLAKIANKPLVTATRTLDPKLFELNEQGALNGHVPITAYISFLTVLIAQLQGYKGVIFSNERSANFGNVTHNNADVNHQWSKSYEFEDMFQNYITEYLQTDVQYFSLLRGMSELAISQLFLQHAEYGEVATSCNKNWRILGGGAIGRSEVCDGGAMYPSAEGVSGSWCGSCPKCAFVFSQFAAFLPAERLTKIFSNNLFADEALLPLYKQLLGIDGIKPFECVGTPDEVRAAFLLALTQEGWENTVVMDLFLAEVAPNIANAQNIIEDVLTLSDTHLIPADFLLQIQS